MRRARALRVVGTAPRPRRLPRVALLVVMALALRRWGGRDAGAIGVAEVRAVLPAAERLVVDRSARAGVDVLDASGRRVGYAVATLPAARDVTGYAGATDALVVLDARDRVAGLRIRASADTASHVADVARDRAFMGQLDGRTWAEAARFDVRASDIDAVSGASMTSRAVMDGVAVRLGGAPPPPAPWRWAATDIAVGAAAVGGLLLAFAGARVRRPIRVAFAVAAVVGLGVGAGDFVSLGVLAGLATGAVSVRAAPGLALLAALALGAPLATGRAVYCQQVCPHGLLQDLIARASPWRWRVGATARPVLPWVARALLASAIVAMVAGRAIDLGALEAFDAYALRGAAAASIAWALAGLAAAVVVPRAYCRFGCPTGVVLGLARGRTTSRRVEKRPNRSV